MSGAHTTQRANHVRADRAAQRRALRAVDPRPLAARIRAAATHAAAGLAALMDHWRPEAVALFDRDGRILYLSPRCERLLAISRVEALGRKPARGELGGACLLFDDAASRGEPFPSPQALREERPRRGLALTVVRPNGSRAAVRASTIPVFRPGSPTPHQTFVLFRAAAARRGGG